ncbi:MAG: cyclic nucleotide-binding domain-containing protein [Spirochaetales bacterium]|nr:cyclic nucleotide-binding domain-containing protein [Spirochaetales bacterium]
MRVNRNVFDKHVKFFGPDMVIFEEGERGEEMYIIVEGEVEIRKSTFSSATKTLTVFKKGDIFGEMALIDKKARSATAVSIRPTKLLVITEALFENIIEKNSDFAKKMIKILSERIRRANSILQNIMVTNRDNQAINGLFQYAHDNGIPTFNGFRINIVEFTQWACEHLGLLKKDIDVVVKGLLKRNIITQSALGKDEVIVKKQRL